MTSNLFAPGVPPLPRRHTTRFALLLGSCLAAMLLLDGCSAPQSIPLAPPHESPQPVVPASPPPAAAISPPVAQEQPITALSEESSIFFPLRSAAVNDDGREKLRRHADRLKLEHKEIIILTGHADGQGSRSYNLAITEERLMAVEKLLRSYGVSARQIRRNRRDSTKNRTQCATSECRQMMRRVELLHSP